MLASSKPSVRFFFRAISSKPMAVNGLTAPASLAVGQQQVLSSSISGSSITRAFSTTSTSTFPNLGTGSSTGPAVSGGGPLDGRERALERDWAQRRDRELLDALVRAQAGTQRHEQKGDLKTILARHGVDESSSPGLLQALLTWQANILNPLLNLTAYSSPKAANK